MHALEAFTRFLTMLAHALSTRSRDVGDAYACILMYTLLTRSWGMGTRVHVHSRPRLFILYLFVPFSRIMDTSEINQTQCAVHSHRCGFPGLVK